MKKSDLVARITGLLVFGMGIAMLVFVFFVAYGFFTTPIKVTPASSGGPSASAVLSNSALNMLNRVGALLVMVLVGSLVAGKGLHMQFSLKGTGDDQETSESNG